MRQFQVPQFITIEDKVIGPFTLKQFGFLAGGALLIVFLRTIFVGLFLYMSASIIGALALALAFLKINDQPFPAVVKNAMFFIFRPRLYTWKKGKSAKVAGSGHAPKNEPEVKVIPKLSVSKLEDLSWSLDLEGRTKQNSQNP